jgi:hypothetical protein
VKVTLVLARRLGPNILGRATLSTATAKPLPVDSRPDDERQALWLRCWQGLVTGVGHAVSIASGHNSCYPMIQPALGSVSDDT